MSDGRMLLVVALVVLVLLLASPAGWMFYGSGMLMMVLLALLIAAVVAAYLPATEDRRALDILAERYARGEIDDEEYRSRRRALQRR